MYPNCHYQLPKEKDMDLVIDKLGRVVIPKKVRGHLHASSRMRLREEADGVYLEALREDPAPEECAGVMIIAKNSQQQPLTADEVANALICERDSRLLIAL
jgi:bifunctional DNA-binding transcriptional regulator/antitoxin component of YhaV-PrlF toxin-antitoxin module